jgi:hypothetical protein
VDEHDPGTDDRDDDHREERRDDPVEIAADLGQKIDRPIARKAGPVCVPDDRDARARPERPRALRSVLI